MDDSVYKYLFGIFENVRNVDLIDKELILVKYTNGEFTTINVCDVVLVEIDDNFNRITFIGLPLDWKPKRSWSQRLLMKKKPECQPRTLLSIPFDNRRSDFVECIKTIRTQMGDFGLMDQIGLDYLFNVKLCNDKNYWDGKVLFHMAGKKMPRYMIHYTYKPYSADEMIQSRIEFHITALKLFQESKSMSRTLTFTTINTTTTTEEEDQQILDNSVEIPTPKMINKRKKNIVSRMMSNKLDFVVHSLFSLFPERSDSFDLPQE